MNAQLIALYDRELQYLREKAAELAYYRPDTASQLGLSLGHGRSQDSHVERLLEGVAYLAARVHLQLESGYSQIAQSLSETIYPQLISPFPACGIVEFQPDASLADDYPISRHSELRVRVVSDHDRQISSPETECIFQTTQEVTLVPIELTDAAYTDRRPDVFHPYSGVSSALRLQIRHLGERPINTIPGFTELTVYIRGMGGAVLAARVYELLLRKALAGGVFQAQGRPPESLPGLKIEAVGFSNQEALLPTEGICYQGYRLLREFLTFPARFMFFKITGLGPALSRCDQSVADIFLGFPDRHSGLETQVNRRLFSLHCTPVINLFHSSATVSLKSGSGEFEIVRETSGRLDHEVYKAISVIGNEVGKPGVREFLPFFQPPRRESDAPAYFSTRRQNRSLTSEEISSKSIPSYLGSELYLSLADPQNPPYSPRLGSVRVETLCTNRHLPLRIAPGSPIQPPVACPATATLLAERSEPQSAILEGDLVWRMISHLSINYLSMIAGEPDGIKKDACVIREVLRVYSDSLRQTGSVSRAETVDRWIGAVREVSAKPIIRSRIASGALALVRGLEVTLYLKEAPLQEVGLLLFGSVLERFLTRFVGINSFLELVIWGDQRGEIKRWDARVGNRLGI